MKGKLLGKTKWTSGKLHNPLILKIRIFKKFNNLELDIFQISEYDCVND